MIFKGQLHREPDVMEVMFLPFLCIYSSRVLDVTEGTRSVEEGIVNRFSFNSHTIGRGIKKRGKQNERIVIVMSID